MLLSGAYYMGVLIVGGAGNFFKNLINRDVIVEKDKEAYDILRNKTSRPIVKYLLMHHLDKITINASACHGTISFRKYETRKNYTLNGPLTIQLTRSNKRGVLNKIQGWENPE